jgi:hypothetical protein
LSRCLIRALVFVAVLGIAAEAHSQAHPPFRIVDSRFSAEDFWPTKWVDNERVLFTGVKVGSGSNCAIKDPRCGGRGLWNGAYVWDVPKNEVTHYKDRILTDLCVHDGYISYKTHERLADKQASIFVGKFGKEQKLDHPSEHQYNNPISCRYHTKPWLPAEAQTRRVALLLEEHGYVDFGPNEPSQLNAQKGQPLPILRSPDGKAVPLNIENRYLMNRRLRFSYVPFSNEYFTKADTVNVAEVVPAFYMTPEGSVRKLEFGVRRLLGGGYHPTRVGVFLTTDGDRSPGSGGGYLLLPGKLVKVVTGAVRSASVSPDGCQVAFIYATSWEAVSQGYRDWKEGKPGNTIRAINVCEGDKK